MKQNFNFAHFIAAIGCSALSASAATFHWDGTTDVALGSSDNTNTASQAWLSDGLWDDGTTSTALASWTAGDSAVFGGSAASQTVTLGSTITVGNLTFGAGADGSGTSGTAYTISGGTLTLSSTALTANTATVITSAISNGGSATISGPGALTLRGNISGAGTLTHSGSGLLTLSAADSHRDNYNALSGAGSIRVGTSGTYFYGLHGDLSGLTGTVTMAGLVHNRASALGSTSAAFVQETGGVWLFSNDDISNLDVTYHMGSLSGSGTLAGTGYNPARTGAKTLSIGALNTDTTYSGSIVNTYAGGGGTVALTKVGTGTLTLAGANSFTGGTTIDDGTLQIGTGTGAAGSLPGNATVNANGTLKFNYGSTGVVYGGQLSGTGAVIVTGNNDLQLSGNNSGFTGILTVDGSGAQLRMRNDNAVSGAALVLANGGAVSVYSYVSSHNLTVGSLESSDPTTWVRLGADNRGLIVGGNNQSTTFAGVIKNDAGGSGFVTKTGTGTLTLSGTNSYTGGTVINEGVIKLGTNTSPLGNGSVTVNSGGTLDLNGHPSASNTGYAPALGIAGTGSAGQGALTNSGGATSNGMIQFPSISLSADASMGGSGNFYMITSGYGATTLTLNDHTLTKTGNNTVSFVNTTISSGTVRISGGTLSQFNTGSNGSAAAFTLDDTAGVALNLNNLNISVGSLAGGGTTGGNVSLGSGTMTVGALDTSTSYAGQINGTGGLTKSGTGTLALTGTSNFTGATAVTGGKLVINGNISTSTLTTVQSGAAIGGSGTVGALTILDGATLAPGNSPGSLNTGTLALADTSISDFEFNPFDQTVGSGINDLVTVSGNLTLDGILNVVATSGDFLSAISGNQWRLFDYTGTLTDNTLTFGTMPSLGSGLSWSVDTATAGQVNLVVVPEPGAALLGGIGMLMLLRRRVRR